MSTPQRPRRKPLFSETKRTYGETRALADDALDSLPPAARSDTDKAVANREAATPVPNKGQRLRAVPSEQPPAGVEVGGSAAVVGAPETGGGDRTAAPQPAAARPKGKSSQPRRRRNKPPEAAVPYDVYLKLKATSAQEKSQDRVTARPFGVIVMDALEHHAGTLMNLWATPEPASAPAEGSLFIRTAPPSCATPPPRRTGSMHTITLSGISGTNADFLDHYAEEWNAGSRAALVEEALRLEFKMPHSPDETGPD